MKPGRILVAVAALLATAGCGEQAANETAASNAPIEAVAPPPGGDWSQMVRQTADGGFLMGNPNADVKVVEYASMTCPHCAEFAHTGMQPLIDKYVKTGRVSFEFRNFVMNGLDLSMSLIARCGGPERFFPLAEAMFENQRQFFDKMQAAPPEQQQALGQTPQGSAQLAGLQPWAAQRGVPSARQQQCLTNQAEIDRLVQMTSDASSVHNVQGTPSFLINGELVEQASTWDRLEPRIREALGS